MAAPNDLDGTVKYKLLCRELARFSAFFKDLVLSRRRLLLLYVVCRGRVSPLRREGASPPHTNVLGRHALRYHFNY